MIALTREQMAVRVAAAIPAGAFINLGIGIPTLVARHVPPDRGSTLHSENGILGFGGPPPAGATWRTGGRASRRASAGRWILPVAPGRFG
jgi:acyl CoA:acetate/3-ketoacid CoA transferase beta subunit